MQEHIDWPEVKYCFKRQLAKCVNECKAQATYAKKLVKTVKTHIKSQSNGELHRSAIGISEDDDDDECGWDTDFDSDDDEPVANYDSGVHLVSANGQYSDENTVQVETSEEMEKEKIPVVNHNSVNGSNEATSETEQTTIVRNDLPKTKPKPPDKPAIPKPPPLNPTLISRLPSAYKKRPSVLPPPPPVTPSPVTSPDRLKCEELEEEEYLIPITTKSQSIPSICSKSPLVNNSFSSGAQSPVPQGSDREGSPGLYEVINSLPDENYESIPDPSHIPNVHTFARSNSLSALSLSSDQPSLPPRSGMPPPPLPEKPRKLSLHTTASLDRSGAKRLDKGCQQRPAETPPPIPTTLADRPILPLPKSIDSCPISRSSSTSSISSCSSATPVARKRIPPSHLTVQNYEDNVISDVANRPLPPLPPSLLSKVQGIQQESLTSWPWFHDIERDNAARKLLDLGEEGAYLVRPSRRAGKLNPYTLTILHESNIFHLNIRQRADGRYALGREKERERSFDSVTDLIKYHQSEPILLTAKKKQAGRTCLKIHLPKS